MARITPSCPTGASPNPGAARHPAQPPECVPVSSSHTPHASEAPASAGPARPLVVDLRDEVSRDPSLTGGKAAALSAAAVAGLSTLPGVVLTTAFCDDVDAGAAVAGHPAVAEAFTRAGGEHQDLVARSSSVVEDTAASSMAGQFESVIGITGLDRFTDAVTAVLDSRA